MARVVDLTAADDRDAILERTDAQGLLRGGRRTAEPLSAYLAEGEVGRYLAVNKSAGLEIAGQEGDRTVEPAGNYRTVALLTDRRLLFVAGGDEGDETVALPLADVIDVEVGSAGMLAEQLVIEGADERTYRFPCRGDLEALAGTVRDDAAAWSHAERLLEDADHDVGRARERLGMGEYDVAIEALDAAETRWQEALESLESVHEAAVAGLAERVDVRREMAAAVRRRIRAEAGASAHAAAQAAWDDGAYERAAEAYDRAVAAYRESRDLSGDEPTDRQLTARLGGAAGERAVLATAPLADADEARHLAEGATDPDVRAAAWESALERYRGALGLEWAGEGTFRVDRGTAREAAADAADAAIEARREAARQWLAAGDKLAATRDLDAAAPVYDRAEAHGQDALALARSVFPEREDEIEAFLTDVDRRRAGEIDPGSTPPDAPLPVDSVGEALDVLEGDVDLPPAGRNAVQTVASAAPVVGTDTEGASGTAAAAESAGVEGTAEDTVSPEAEAPPAGVGEARGAFASGDPEALLADLRDMDPADFRQFVAEAWAARGWATTVFPASGSGVYDVFGIHEGSGERLLLWSHQAGPDERLGVDAIERCQATVERSQGATRAAVVTTGPVGEAARSRAETLGVDLVDGEALCDVLAATDRLAALPSADGDAADSADI